MAKKKAVQKPKLFIYAAAWTLQNYPSAEKQWSPETKVKRAKEAGFNGISHGTDPEWAKAIKKHGMGWVGGVDVASVAEAADKLQKFKDNGVTHINIQLCDHDTEVSKSLPVARKVMQVGKEMGLKPAIEVHRDTCTETPEKAFALASAYEKKHKEKLRMNFDHSHPVIVKQLRPPSFWSRLAEHRLDLFKMQELTHLRTFTGSHCQTPVTNGRGQLDGDFIAWRDNYVKPMLAAWLQGARADKELHAVIELGPRGSGYALECFPDVWKDAIVARGEVEKVWKSQLRKWKK
jgi:hypothetical protein